MSLKLDVEEKWYFFYDKLKSFRDLHGHSDVPYESAEFTELAKWVKIQRKAKQRLPNAFKEKLLELDFDFSDSSQNWEENYRELQSFARKYGHVHVPSSDPAYSELRAWLSLQIKNKDYLNNTQKQKLDYLGVNWHLTDSREWRWQEMYNQLLEFHKEYGHSRVPQKWDVNRKLSNWVLVQRRGYMQGIMSSERKRKLEQLGFVWDFKYVYEDQWEEKFQLLVEFIKENGHTKVPLTYVDQRLAGWVDRQRTVNSKGKLSEERKRKLDEVEFIWDCDVLQERLWDERYQQLVEYQKKYGDCMVPVNWKQNRQLGIWVAAQRTIEKNRGVDPEKKKKLEKIGFIWHGEALKEQQKKYDDIWEHNFNKYVAYTKKTGQLQVSLKIDRALQRWTCEQRKKWLSGRLDEDKMDKLSSVEFPWNLHESYWMRKYSELVAFKKEFGHTRVQWRWEHNPQLGQWVSRTRLHKYSLTKQQIKLLDKIGFDWKTTKKIIVPWITMYQSLVNFKRTYGHTRVPVNWKQNRKLGKWISRIRSEQDKLQPNRRKLLEELDFDWTKRRGRFKNREYRLESA
jgi:glutaredoxin